MRHTVNQAWELNGREGIQPSVLREVSDEVMHFGHFHDKVDAEGCVDNVTSSGDVHIVCKRQRNTYLKTDNQYLGQVIIVLHALSI